MKIKHIAFTMYPVKDMARARAFYEGVLGLGDGREAAAGKWVEYYLENGCFAITTMTPVQPGASMGGSIAFEVESLDAAMAKLAAANAIVKVPPFPTRVCRMAIVLDTEGNAVTLHEKKPA